MNNILYFLKHRFITKLKRIPLGLLALIIINACYGILVLYSAGGNNFYPWAYKQSIFFITFFVIMLMIATINLRIIFHYSYFLYFAIIILLVMVSLLGHSAMGAKRWLNLGIVKVQPSEPAKIIIILMLARYFHGLSLQQISQIKYIIIALLATIIPTLLIIKQPDLGTGLITIFVSGVIFFAAGVRVWKFVSVLLIGAISAPIIWSFLREYQKKRILVFLHPELDPYGSGYNIIQSKIAIGSGGLFGKGLFHGTQSRLSFLPEHQTDFIFPTLAEELGFAGGITLLFIYFAIIYLSLAIAINARSMFAKLLAIGVTSLFFFHIFINMGMVMGLLPVVGIPLPFMSYGGTMMASICIGFGLIMNVHVNKNISIK